MFRTERTRTLIKAGPPQGVGSHRVKCIPGGHGYGQRQSTRSIVSAHDAPAGTSLTVSLQGSCSEYKSYKSTAKVSTAELDPLWHNDLHTHKATELPLGREFRFDRSSGLCFT